jgi:filamentous hemagglutinin
VDITNPRELQLRIPSGNEAGANDLWIPGGRLPNGNSEAIVDAKGPIAPKLEISPLSL